MSGVTVPTMMASMSVAAIPRCARAFLAACDREIAGGNALVDDMPLADADAGHDPFIVGVDHFFEVGIGEQARRHIRAQSADFGADRFRQQELLK